MGRGRILLIDGDEWLGRLLGCSLESKGYDTVYCEDARSGFQAALENAPDGIVCSVVLPDIDGFWVARRIRTEGGSVAKTPILLIGEARDRDIRLQALQVGADVLLERPLSNDEVVAQVDALVTMAARYAQGSADDLAHGSLGAAFRGDLSGFPLASVLMMLEMERRSGTLEVHSISGTRALLTLSAGLFSQTRIDGFEHSALETLRQVLAWRSGRFAFRTRDPGSLPPPRTSVAAVLLEAMRIEDERKIAGAPRPTDRAF